MTKKKTHEIVVPVGKTVTDLKGRRVGAGNTAQIDSVEHKEIEKFIKPEEVKDGDN